VCGTSLPSVHVYAIIAIFPHPQGGSISCSSRDSGMGMDAGRNSGAGMDTGGDNSAGMIITLCHM